MQKAVAESLVMIRESAPDQKVLSLKALETLKTMGEGQATKLIIPGDLAGLGGVFAALKETASEPAGK